MFRSCRKERSYEINHQGDCHDLYCRSDLFNDHGGVREDEQEHGIKSNLPSAAEETAENLLTKKYNVTDKNQLEADFLETLAYAIDSDSNIRLKVNAADKEKQLLSVSVTEEFKHPNGKPGTVSYDRTAVVNKLQEEVLETYQVSYYLTNTDTDCYKRYTVLQMIWFRFLKIQWQKEKHLQDGQMQREMLWIRI